MDMKHYTKRSTTIKKQTLSQSDYPSAQKMAVSAFVRRPFHHGNSYLIDISKNLQDLELPL